jgi:hypothetical protein
MANARELRALAFPLHGISTLGQGSLGKNGSGKGYMQYGSLGEPYGNLQHTLQITSAHEHHAQSCKHA